LAGSRERLVHELSLGEAHPPLAWLVGLRVKDFLGQSQAGLLAKLLQETSHRVFLLFVGRPGVHGVERELSLAWNEEPADGQRLHLLHTLPLRLTLLKLLETLGDVQREVDESPISLTLDLVIPKEDVGLEKHQRFIDNVQFTCIFRRWSLELRPQGKQCHVADDLRRVNKRRMIGRHPAPGSGNCRVQQPLEN